MPQCERGNKVKLIATMFLCAPVLLLSMIACTQQNAPKTIRVPSEIVTRAAFSASGEKVYSCWKKGAVRIYESASGKLLKEFQVPFDEPEQQQLFWIDVTKDEKKIL